MMSDREKNSKALKPFMKEIHESVRTIIASSNPNAVSDEYIEVLSSLAADAVSWKLYLMSKQPKKEK